MSWDFNFGLMPYGPSWRAHRRMLHQHFYPIAVQRYIPYQQEHLRALLGLILKSPEHTREHVRQ